MVNALAGLPEEAVVVAAAGNAGRSRPAWPAALPEVVAVAAVDVADGAVAPDPDSGFGHWVDACAAGSRPSTYVPGQLALPGLPVRTFEGYASWRGTSFAAPHVCGRVAATMTAEGISAADACAVLLSGEPWHPDYGVLVT